MNQNGNKNMQTTTKVPVKKIEIYGLKIRDEIKEGTDLASLIVEESKKSGIKIEENDVVVITSKIVSKAEGRYFDISKIKVSKKAHILSKLFGKNEKEVQLILQNSDKIEYVIPIWKLAQKFGHFYDVAKDEKVAKELIKSDPYIFVCKVGNILLTDAGLDFSNSPKNYCTLPPKDADKSAKEIRERIKQLTGKDVAVIITDTEWKLDKFGTIDIAIGSSGIQPVSRNFGEKDLYGKPKFGGVDDLTDLLAASANLLFGQTGEGVPVVIIRGLRYEKSEKGVKDFAYPEKAFSEALRMALLDNIKFKVVSKFLDFSIREEK
jgi:coenzyme F420-0:L-glutamate ligase/coenzyme F420-1:gamma-L-glutamate ligase